MAQVKFFTFDTDGMPIEHDPVNDELTIGSLALDSGGSGIDMNSTKVSDMASATASGDALAFGQTGGELGDLTITSGGDIDVSGGGELTGLPASPSGDTAAASKAYVDSVAQGLDVHDSVVAATTALQVLADDFENTDVIDGVTLATGDRILIKDQSSGIENGIYIVQASGAPVRADDWANGYAAAGAFVFVEEGTANADNGFVCTNDGGADVTNTDALVFSQFSGAGQVVAGTGLTKSGNTINAIGGNGITANANDLEVAPDSTTGGNVQPVNVVANGVGLDVAAIAGTGIEADGSADLQLSTQGNGITGGGGSVLSVLADILSTTTTEANAVIVGSNGLSVKVDDSSIEGSGQGSAGAEALRIKEDGVTGPMLADDITFTTTGDITANAFTGDGSGLTNLPAAASTDAVTISCLKSTAGTLTAGQVVHLVGYSSPDYTVELADADAAALMPAIGIVTSTVTEAAAGSVTISGRAQNLDTSSWSAGDRLYVDTTAGALTSTRPNGATTQIQAIGEVAFSHASTGVIQVTGAGRSNDIPQIAEDNLWVGDSNGDGTATPVHDGLTVTPGTSLGIELSASAGLELSGTSPNKTLQAKVDGSTIQINGSGELEVLASEEAQVVRTNYTTDGTGVTKGDPVYLSANDIVSAANANNDNTRKYIGIAAATIGASAAVEIISAGKVDDVTIAGSPAAGDLVYLAVGGGLTTTIPPYTSGNHRLVIGKVANASGSPDLHIEPQYLGKVR